MLLLQPIDQVAIARAFLNMSAVLGSRDACGNTAP